MPSNRRMRFVSATLACEYKAGGVRGGVSGRKVEWPWVGGGCCGGTQATGERGKVGRTRKRLGGLTAWAARGGRAYGGPNAPRSPLPSPSPPCANHPPRLFPLLPHPPCPRLAARGRGRWAREATAPARHRCRRDARPCPRRGASPALPSGILQRPRQTAHPQHARRRIECLASPLLGCSSAPCAHPAPLGCGCGPYYAPPAPGCSCGAAPRACCPLPPGIPHRRASPGGDGCHALRCDCGSGGGGPARPQGCADRVPSPDRGCDSADLKAHAPGLHRAARPARRRLTGPLRASPSPQPDPGLCLLAWRPAQPHWPPWKPPPPSAAP